MSARILPFPAPTSLATIRAFRLEAHDRACEAGRAGNYPARTVALKDLRHWDDELRAAEVRAMRLNADRARRRLEEARDPRRRVGALLMLLEIAGGKSA